MKGFQLVGGVWALEVRRTLAIAVSVFGLAAAGRAQQPAQTPTVPPAASPVTTLSVTTREVLLDVLVTDSSGHPVTGLKPADFAVTEEGAPQTIRNLEEHHPMTAGEVAKLQAAPVLPVNTFTNFTPAANTNASTVILLDSLDTPLSSQMYLREQLIAYLKNMRPGTSIAIFQLDTQMRLIQSFSSDQETLLAAAKSKRDMPSLQKPLSGTQEQYLRIKREILREAMQSLGRYLAAFPGRKNLVWFTGEVPLTIFGTGLGSPFKDTFNVLDSASGNFDDLADALTLSRVAVYPIDSRGLQTNPQFDVSGRRPGSGPGFQVRQNFNQFDLEDVAALTGGKAYYNTNGLKDVLAQIVDNGSNYYTLVYATTNKTWDGQFRHIKVAMDRPGLTLQHRNGYYAVNRDQQEQRQLAALQRRKARATSKQGGSTASDEPNAPNPDAGALIPHPAKDGVAASMILGAVAPTEIVFTASLAAGAEIVKLDKKSPLPPNNFLRPAYQGKPFRTFTVLIKADPSRIKLTQTPDGVRHGVVQFIVVVYDQSGETVNSLESAASLDLGDAVYQRMLQEGLPMKQEVAVPTKGNYFLRLGVHDVASDEIGALEIPLDQVKMDVPVRGLPSP